MPGLAMVLLGLALTAACFIGLVTWRSRPQTPARIPHSPSPGAGAAVETPEAGADSPPTVPASGDTPGSDFDRHVDDALEVANDRPHGHAWCFPCQAVICVRTATDVVAHLRSHAQDPAVAADFDAWEAEFHPASGTNTDRSTS